MRAAHPTPEEHTLDVGARDPAQLIERYLFQRLHENHARVVDQHVESAVAALDCGHRLLPLALVPHVERNELGAPAAASVRATAAPMPSAAPVTSATLS
jgi:hypothetical protein